MTERPLALVTGGSKGIGAAIARGLAADGFEIWLNYLTDHEAAESVAAQIGDLGSACRLLPFDVSNEAEASLALADLLDQRTPFAVVNNAGFARDGLFFWMSPEDWRSVLRVHLDGFFNITKLVLPKLIAARAGRIINVASTSGQAGMAGQVNYAAAKAGLVGATKSLAREVARRGILVNAVAPGFVDTEMVAGLPPDELRSMIPMGRLGRPEEIAGVVRFLCSAGASYITGQVLSINGGAYM